VCRKSDPIISKSGIKKYIKYFFKLRHLLIIPDVAVKSVDGSRSSRELEDLQETRE
jgi:hypothetical protein